MANSRLCSIPDCGKPHDSKGYCCTHYQRLQRHGDPLGGRVPYGEPMRWINEVALLHSAEECLSWPFGKSANGYGAIKVGGEMVLVHRHICELAHGAPPTPEHEAAHSCGKGHEACIAPGHLEWKTPTENQADRLEHGTHCRGERSVRAKLTEDAVRTIIALKDVEAQPILAERFGVSQKAIYQIQTGRTWGWLTGVPKPKSPAMLGNAEAIV